MNFLAELASGAFLAVLLLTAAVCAAADVLVGLLLGPLKRLGRRRPAKPEWPPRTHRSSG